MRKKIGRETARFFLTVFFIFMAAPLPAQQTLVKVNVPEKVSGDFDFTIGIENALDLDSGQFDLSFDPDAVKILDVKNGRMGDAQVPVDLWTLPGPDRVRVIFNFPGVSAISGTGHLAEINARVIGKAGKMISLDFHKGLLVDENANAIPTDWINGQTKVQKAAAESDPVQAPLSKKESGPETRPQGITLSTPMALTGLAVLVAIPGLFLILYTKRRGRG